MSSEQGAALALVRSALARARVAQVVLGLFVAGLGWVMTLADHSTLGGQIMVFGMAGFFALIAAVLFWVAFFKSSPNRSPLVRALRDHPDDVVWVYQQDTQVKVDGIDAPTADTNVFAKLADGSTVAITVNKSKAESLMNALKTLAPRAAVGFSEEREAQFKRDPRSL